ncbi:MAG: AAA family ATPase, partial [Pseudomonadota bacterium]
ANGGYLLLDARRVLSAPESWETLKRALRTSEISIDSPYASHSAQTTVTLEPATIPLNVKVIIFGNRSIYYRLASMDPDFSELFKVAADFDDRIERDRKNIGNFTRLLAGIAKKENLKPLNKTGMAAVVERAVRMTDDQERMTLRVGPLADLLLEANYVAVKAGSKAISREHVRDAIDQQIRRVDRVRERFHERILRDSVLIDVSGDKVGQINGLAVMSIGGFRFGKPSRITARTRMGNGRVIDIERGSDLGGSIHSKGILILSSYLSNTYARDVPVTMAASIAFEQSYGGVDGDSASSTELYALLSSLSGVPINQGLSVTGSVNQYGEVQVIGGANEKIEGFFDICCGRPGGLTGNQGVLLPEGNVKNLMLRPDVVDACKAGQFHIYSISHIDQGIEILTGTTAGKRGKNGQYPVGSINRLVEDQLITFAEMRRDFGRGKRADDKPGNNNDDNNKAEPAKSTKKKSTKKAAKKKSAAKKRRPKIT